jgi:hypothetical protein
LSWAILLGPVQFLCFVADLGESGRVVVGLLGSIWRLLAGRTSSSLSSITVTSKSFSKDLLLVEFGSLDGLALYGETSNPVLLFRDLFVK